MAIRWSSYVSIEAGRGPPCGGWMGRSSPSTSTSAPRLVYSGAGVDRGGGEEVGRVARVGLDDVVDGAVRRAVGDDDAPRLLGLRVEHELGRDVELVHQPHRHRDVRPTRRAAFEVDVHLVARV